MMEAILMSRRALLLVAFALAGCASPPRERAPQQPHAGFPAQAYDVRAGSGRVFEFDPAQSKVAIHVFRAGALASRGHNHVIAATGFRGAAYLPAEGMDDARFDLEIPVQQLVVDPPDLRRVLGASFDTTLSEKQRGDTRANMLEGVLEAERFPTIVVSSRRVHGELPKLALQAEITLRGQSREQLVPVDVRIQGGRLVATGALAIRQTEHGIEPFSAVGGLLQVADVVTVEFELVGQAR